MPIPGFSAGGGDGWDGWMERQRVGALLMTPLTFLTRLKPSAG